MILPHYAGGESGVRAAAQKGAILFHKREWPPLDPPRERLGLAVSGLNDLYASGMGMSARGVAALALLYDLTCSYYPLLRSRWRLCCLTDAAHPLRVSLCQSCAGAV